MYRGERELAQTPLLAELDDAELDCYVNSPEEVAQKVAVWNETHKKRYEQLQEKRRARLEDLEQRRVQTAIHRKRAKAEAPTRTSDAISQALHSRGSSSGRVNYDNLASLLNDLPPASPSAAAGAATAGDGGDRRHIPDLPEGLGTVQAYVQSFEDM